jgi:hypothetical protein
MEATLPTDVTSAPYVAQSREDNRVGHKRNHGDVSSNNFLKGTKVGMQTPQQKQLRTDLSAADSSPEKISSGGCKLLKYRVMKTDFPLMSTTVVLFSRLGNLEESSDCHFSAISMSFSSSLLSN